MKTALAGLLLAGSLGAWNHVGHKAIAGMAWDLLNTKARERAGELIRRHPDYAMLSEGGPEDPAARIRYAFMQSAYWPDIIRGDLRFYDEARRDATPTETKPGFPDMKQRKNWHYINIAFSTDGTPVLPSPAPNVLTQVEWLMSRVGGKPNPGSEDDPIFLLPWFLHLVGDIHQPLHCATRYRSGQVNPADGKPWSDLGGNTVNVVGAYNLHAFWDDTLGITDTHAFVNGVIKVMNNRTAGDASVLTPSEWANEGFELAKSAVYSFGNEGGGKDSPIQLGPDYTMRARQLGLERASLAARRLAAILNRELGN